MTATDPIRFRCPDCDKLLRVPAERAGKRVKCPGCGHGFPVPAAHPVAPAAVPVSIPVAIPLPAGLPPTDTVDPPAAVPAAPRRRRPRWVWYLGGAAALALAAGAVFFIITALTGGRAKRFDPEREEKLRAAIQRCGSYGGSITSESMTVLEVALAEMNQERNDLSAALSRAARAVARKEPKASFHILVFNSSGFTLAQLRESLGKEDTAEPGSIQVPARFGTESRGVTWHVYGWCAFGTEGDGRIVAIRVDCAALPAELR